MQFPIHGEAAEPSILLEEIGASRYNKTTDLECHTVSIGVEDGVPGSLFSGRLVAFMGNDIMMARPHEVQWFTKTISTTS